MASHVLSQRCVAAATASVLFPTARCSYNTCDTAPGALPGFWTTPAPESSGQIVLKGSSVDKNGSSIFLMDFIYIYTHINASWRLIQIWFSLHLASPHFSCTPSTWRAQTWLLYPWGRRQGAVWNLVVLPGGGKISTRFRQNLNVDQTDGPRSGSCVTELLNTAGFCRGLFSGSDRWRFVGFR